MEPIDLILLIGSSFSMLLALIINKLENATPSQLTAGAILMTSFLLLVSLL